MQEEEEEVAWGNNNDVHAVDDDYAANPQRDYYHYHYHYSIPNICPDDGLHQVGDNVCPLSNNAGMPLKNELLLYLSMIEWRGTATYKLAPSCNSNRDHHLAGIY